jgi:hypothetical protein
MGKDGKRDYDVYYWKDLAYVRPDATPQLQEINNSHMPICRIRIAPDVDVTEALDFIFAELNYKPGKYVTQCTIALLGDCAHTSMSVGDVVKTGNDWYVCRSAGWEKL